MTFIEALLQDPNGTMETYPYKSIDPMNHNFDDESLSDRLYSLYLVLCFNWSYKVSYYTPKDVIKRIKKYKKELEFLYLANDKKSNPTKVNEAWVKLLGK